MSGKYTEEELSKLSPTEREVLAGGDEENEEILNDIAGDDDDEGDDDDGDGGSGDGEGKADGAEDKQQADDQDGESDKPDDQDADQSADDVTTAEEFNIEDVPAVTFVPKLSGEILPSFQAEIDKVETSKQAELDALEEKMEAGEISAKEYREASRKIDAEIRTETRKLEAASQNAEMGSQLWQAEQLAFFKANPEYTQAKNPAEWEKLNKELLKVANDPANAKLTGIQTLCLAKHNLSEAAAFAEFKAARALQKAGKAPADGKETIPKKPAAKRPGTEHQTLRDVPAADAADVGQDKFSHLDKLSGIALEAAVSRLSPEDYKAYVSGV